MFSINKSAALALGLASGAIALGALVSPAEPTGAKKAPQSFQTAPAHEKLAALVAAKKQQQLVALAIQNAQQPKSGEGEQQNGQSGEQGEKQSGQSGEQGEKQNGQSGEQGEKQNGQNGDQGGKSTGQSKAPRPLDLTRTAR